MIFAQDAKIMVESIPKNLGQSFAWENFLPKIIAAPSGSNSKCFVKKILRLQYLVRLKP